MRSVLSLRPKLERTVHEVRNLLEARTDQPGQPDDLAGTDREDASARPLRQPVIAAPTALSLGAGEGGDAVTDPGDADDQFDQPGGIYVARVQRRGVASFPEYRDRSVIARASSRSWLTNRTRSRRYDLANQCEQVMALRAGEIRRRLVEHEHSAGLLAPAAVSCPTARAIATSARWTSGSSATTARVDVHAQRVEQRLR